jgi:hypothetical protein
MLDDLEIVKGTMWVSDTCEHCTVNFNNLKFVLMKDVFYFLDHT